MTTSDNRQTSITTTSEKHKHQVAQHPNPTERKMEDEIRLALVGAMQDATRQDNAYTAQDLLCAGFDQNDSGNGERLRHRYGDSLFFLKNIGWHVWTGKCWSASQGAIMANQLADLTYRAIEREARAIAAKGAGPYESPEAFEKRIRRHFAFGKRSGNVPKRRATLEAAQPYITKEVVDLDRNPLSFNCENGTLCMKKSGTIRLRKHDRRDYITRISPVKYLPDASCPQFLKFIASILPDPEVRIFIQQWAGVSLTGDVSSQSIVLMHGTGANGKSTLEAIVRHILGDYALTINFASLLRDDRGRGADASPDLARLRGVRGVFASEPEQSVQFSEGLIKQMTGGDPIVARHLNQEFFEYLPKFKIWAAFNHRPKVVGTDTGIWRRLKLVPFIVTIAPADRDPHLLEKLKGEASGILNWMLDGYRHWCDRGLVVPAAIEEATSEYRDLSDTVGQFLEEVVIRPAAGDTPRARLYEAFKFWARQNGMRPMSSRSFCDQLRKEKGLIDRKSSDWYWLGVEIRTEWSGYSSRSWESRVSSGRYADS